MSIIIKDSMVLIHLAKATLLELSCDYFGNVFIPKKVKEEVIVQDFPDSKIIESLINSRKINVKNVNNKSLIKKANEFNIQGGEAEALALYWELKADIIATDDDNVRKKQEILKLNLIGTPTILLKLYKEKRIDKIKIQESIKKIREIGWFANTVWDKIILEVNRDG